MSPPAAPALLAALLLAACGGGASGDGPAAPATTCPIAVAVAAPTFSGHVLPALRQACGPGSAITCHGEPAPAGKVSWAAARGAGQVWADLVGAAPSNAPTGQGWLRVAPGDPGRSWILEKVTSENPGSAAFGAYGARMPLQAPDLCDATVQALRGWIERGAPND
jgi:hypothetical protein